MPDAAIQRGRGDEPADVKGFYIKMCGSPIGASFVMDMTTIALKFAPVVFPRLTQPICR